MHELRLQVIHALEKTISPSTFVFFLAQKIGRFRNILGFFKKNLGEIEIFLSCRMSSVNTTIEDDICNL